jgi:hypothetical protein
LTYDFFLSEGDCYSDFQINPTFLAIIFSTQIHGNHIEPAERATHLGRGNFVHFVSDALALHSRHRYTAIDAEGVITNLYDLDLLTTTLA